MLGRRLLVLLLVLLGLTALAAAMAPRAVQLARQRAAPPVAASGGTAVPPVEKTLLAEGADQKVVVRQGQSVVIDVEGEQVDTVAIENLGNRTVDPDSPAHFELLADTPGSYAIELLDANRQIGTLEVRPAR
jgi:hypothetical protein